VDSDLIALFDACVLFPAPLRDLLVQLALADIFQAKWTDQIHEEWIRNVLKNRQDLAREQLERTKGLMNSKVRDCLVTGYEWLIPSLQLPDLDDRHVLAAAITSNAKIIVTFNLKDFPDSALNPYGIEAKHPDDFIADLIELQPLIVPGEAEVVRQRLKNPPKTFDEYTEILLKQGLPGSVTMLKKLNSPI
jgi:predicted nucleic acid-binding protein